MPGRNSLLLGLLVGALPSLHDARNLSQRLVSWILSILFIVFFSILCYFLTRFLSFEGAWPSALLPRCLCGLDRWRHLVIPHITSHISSDQFQDFPSSFNWETLWILILLSWCLPHIYYLDVSTALPGASSSQPSSATVSSQTTTPGYFLSFLAERTFKHFILRWLSMLWWRGLRAAWWRSATTSWAAPPLSITPTRQRPGITLLMRTDAQNCDEEYLFLRNFGEQK